MEKSDMNIKSAVLWQLQHIVKNKLMNSAQTEIDKIFEKTQGEDYRKYLIKFLLQEIDFSVSRQKETAKLNLLKPYLVDLMQSPYFLTKYVFEFYPEFNNI